MGQLFLSKMQFSEGTHFLKSTQTVLESSKSDICQKWPEQVLGHVSRSFVSKFDPKSPKGGVPTVQSKFLTRDAIRWFKCKLKPPKNQTVSLEKHKWHLLEDRITVGGVGVSAACRLHWVYYRWYHDIVKEVGFFWEKYTQDLLAMSL